jgi:predicted metalloendopeptidase
MIRFSLQEKVKMMVDYLIKSFGERVNQMDWLSDFSKQASIEKLNAITAHSAFPAEFNNSDYVSGFYSRVSKRDDNDLMISIEFISNSYIPIVVVYGLWCSYLP